VVLDADRPTEMSDDMLRIASHVVFSSECLRATTGVEDLGDALGRIAGTTESFLAVTDGPRDVLWREGSTLRRSPVFAVQAVDTLGAGDVFHGAFTLALAEGRDVVAAIRFAAAAAGLKCTRLGGITTAPHRAQVEALLAANRPAAGDPLTIPLPNFTCGRIVF
jgi:sugar/nucleoside kinase (ribokinase family)